LRRNLHEFTRRDIGIIFIGSQESGAQCDWARFTALANRVYEAGYGGVEVATDLRIVFSDGVQMTRGEYDGSEWWEYNVPFKMPEEKKEIAGLFGGSWVTLTDIARGDV